MVVVDVVGANTWQGCCITQPVPHRWLFILLSLSAFLPDNSGNNKVVWMEEEEKGALPASLCPSVAACVSLAPREDCAMAKERHPSQSITTTVGLFSFDCQLLNACSPKLICLSINNHQDSGHTHTTWKTGTIPARRMMRLSLANKLIGRMSVDGTW